MTKIVQRPEAKSPSVVRLNLLYSGFIQAGTSSINVYCYRSTITDNDNIYGNK